MPKARKRKQPLTTSTSDDPNATSSSSPQASRKLIRRFHVLLKKKAQSNEPTSILDHSKIQDEVNALGGLEAYQKMSSIGQGYDRGGGSEKVLISWLRSRDYCNRKTKARLLEVGALRPDNFRACQSWLDVSPIDLRSRHPNIAEQDFLLMDQEKNAQAWDIISLSLVLNFVPKATHRGLMLRMAHDMLVPNGLLFVALPQPCVTNSRYLTLEHFRLAMASIGMEQIETKRRTGGKMVYWLFRKSLAPAPDSIGQLPDEVVKKKTVLLGGNRNNFCILF